MKETGTAYGHVLDGEIRHVDLTYVDQNTPVVVYDKDWQNNRQRVEVSVLKKEKILTVHWKALSLDYLPKKTLSLRQQVKS